MLTTPLHLLADIASQKPGAPAFKVPIVDPETDQIAYWKSITYSEFALDVLRLAAGWRSIFQRDGVSPGSVVAICLGGYKYLDVVHVYSIQRAGYIPHTFSRLPGIEIVKDLLKASDSKALVRASQFKEVLGSIRGIPIYDAMTSIDSGDVESIPDLPPLQKLTKPDDLSIIIHTSGSTSGRPKLVRATHRFINALIQKGPVLQGSSSTTIIVNWIGNICHAAQYVVTLSQILHGRCTVQARNPGDLDEIIDQLKRASLTRLYLFSPLVVKLLQRARSDPEVLTLLSRLESIVAGGATFPQSEVAFVVENNINIIEIFASTEAGINLVTKGTRYDPTGVYRVIDTPGVSYQFDPVSPEAESQPQLLELVVRSDSIDCPGPEFRRADDGHFHSGDLWEKVETGYLYRGRDDDWIKSESALICDTKAIEHHVRLVCGDLISECVVVGYGRPSPALFVEPNLRVLDVPEAHLKRLIVKRIDPFNSQRMDHEKITSADLVMIVPPNTLPRTEVKGNVRRKATEDMFKEELDSAYGRL
ncbi:acetyl-CoA synthetase-like protein [Marasmius fiardii PR-910]|nr:acetyl-CoA synthetase-like protein [Marasmius fiardii PR-910]